LGKNDSQELVLDVDKVLRLLDELAVFVKTRKLGG
jgi:hypothetical protein